MRIQCDSLKHARLLRKKGMNPNVAEDFMSTLTEIHIFNIYSKQEVDGMLSEAVKEVFATQDQKLAEQRREFDARMQDTAKYHEQQIRDNKSELLASRHDNRSELLASRRDNRNEMNASRRESRIDSLTSRRWMVGTMITVGLSLAAYLSALIHFNH